MCAFDGVQYYVTGYVDTLLFCSDRSWIFARASDWNQSDTCLTLVCPGLIPIGNLVLWNIRADSGENSKRILIVYVGKFGYSP